MMRGERIVERRKALDLSQEALADMAHTDQKAVSAYENNRRDPTGDTVAALARSLETSSDYLLGLTDDPTPHVEPDGLNSIERAAILARRRGDLAEAARLILSL